MRVLTLTAIYPSAERPEYGAFIKAQVESLRQAGIETDVFVIKGNHKLLMYLKAMLQLPRHISKGYDLIHAHYSYSGIVARTQFSLPIVVSLMGSDLLGVVDERGKSTFLSFLTMTASQWLCRMVTGIIVKSDEMASLVPVPSQVIPNGVDFKTFQPEPCAQARARLGLPMDKKLVLFAANPANGRKRFDIAQAAFDLIKDKHPDAELKVVHKETQTQLAAYLNACDVMLFPSAQEGSPNIVKQAMACNLPILATDVGDIRQLFQNATHSYVCDANPQAFATKLHDFLLNPARSNGREAIAHLDEKIVAQQIMHLYKDVLTRRNKHNVPNSTVAHHSKPTDSGNTP